VDLQVKTKPYPRVVLGTRGISKGEEADLERIGQKEENLNVEQRTAPAIGVWGNSAMRRVRVVF